MVGNSDITPLGARSDRMSCVLAAILLIAHAGNLRYLQSIVQKGGLSRPPGRNLRRSLDGCGDVMEGRYDRLKRLNMRRSIDRFGQDLQHFGVDAGVVVVGIALVLPQTD